MTWAPQSAVSVGGPSDEVPVTSAVPGWLADAALGRLWRAVRSRLERNGLRAGGRLRLAELQRAERHALSGLLGRSVLGDACTIDLADLDATLRARSGIGGLVDVVAAVTDRPLRDRVREREDRAARREAPLDLARRLVTGPWAEDWVTGLASSGVLTGRDDAVPLVEAAALVLSRLVPGATSEHPDLVSRTGSGPGAGPRRPGETFARVDLAAATTGDAHALDDDRLLASVVLRALCAVSGVPWPTSTGARRELWEAFGVTSDSVSSTCLTLGLRLDGDAQLARRLAIAADAGAPVHLTGWDLRDWPAIGARRDAAGAGHDAAGVVLVCENPRVLEAVAGRYAGRLPVVCTAGEPNTVVTRVLGRLTAQGARLLSHGDFDWPGIAIVSRLVDRFGVEPWLMDAAAYRSAATTSGLELSGEPVGAPWDPDLTEEMVTVGRAVHEEAVLGSLLEGLEALLAT